MAHSKKRKPIAIIFTSVVALGMVAYVQWRTYQGATEDSPESDALSQAVTDTPETRVPQADPAGPRTAVSRWRSRTAGDMVKEPARSFAQVTIPHDIALDNYKMNLWQEIQDDPPQIRQVDDPAIDAEQAYRLYMFYGNCSMAPRSGQQIDQGLKQIEKNVLSARAEQLHSLEGRANRLINFYELCSSIPPDVDSRMEAVMWMTEAVLLGHEVAEIQFYEKAMGFILRADRYLNRPPLAMLHPQLVEEFKYTARLGFDRAMEKGHPEVYLAKSHAFLEGLIYQRDPMLAFAYALRAEMEAAHNRTIAANVGSWKQEIAQYLDQDQIVEARKLALEMHSTLDN